jgi:hypothetical protein
MTYPEDHDRPPQDPHQGYGQQYPQDGQWQPQQPDPFAYRQPTAQPPGPGGQQPPWQAQPPGDARYAQQERYGQQPRDGQYGQQQPYSQPWPPQDQRYAPQAPPQWQQPQYAPQQPWQQPQQPYQQPPQQPRGRKRRTLGCLTGFAVLFAAAIGIGYAVSSSGHTVRTAGSSSAGTPGTTASRAAAKTAGIGSAITLAGENSGEQMTVTVVKVIASASENDGLSLVPAGDRLYAVQFRLADTGSAAYSDAPSNGAAAVDSAGQSYQAGLETVSGCQSFPATENIAPGSSGLGCIVFEVPTAAKITQVQFTLDSGFGPQTGQWNVG